MRNRHGYADDPHSAWSVGERIDLPRQSDQEQAIAEERRGHGPPEQREVAMPKRRQNARSASLARVLVHLEKWGRHYYATFSPRPCERRLTREPLARCSGNRWETSYRTSMSCSISAS